LGKGGHEGGGVDIHVNDNQEGAEDAPQQGTAQLQIIGSHQHHDKIEVQEDQLIGDEVVDAGNAEQNEKSKDLFKVSGRYCLSCSMNEVAVSPLQQPRDLEQGRPLGGS